MREKSNFAKKVLSLKKKKYKFQDMYRKKKIFFNYFFISILFLNRKNFFKGYNFKKENQLYLFTKKKLWKFITKAILTEPFDYLKILEMIIVGKKLNMKKNLAKLLSLFLIQKITPYFWWKIALNLENLKKYKNFDLDLTFLYIIKKTDFIEYFFQQYFIFKIKSLDRTLCILTKDKIFQVFNGFKVKYFEKILFIIGFNLLKLNSSDLPNLITYIIGKNIWVSPRISLSLEELINYLIFRPKISFKNIEAIRIITLPTFPVLHSFWLFSILREYILNFGVFLNHKTIKSIFGDTKKKSREKILKKKFFSISSPLAFISNDFFLYP